MKMKSVVTMVLLSVYLLVNNALAAAAPPPPPKPSANHLLMVLQWGKAYCTSPSKSSSKCHQDFERKMPYRFLIHGCWPKPDTVCPGQLVNTPDLETFYKTEATRLNDNWPNAIGIGSVQPKLFNMKFWSYEWNKHGICQTLLQGPYFKFVLDRYDDLSSIHEGIVQKYRPNAVAVAVGVMVNVLNVIQYVKTNHNVDIQISCTSDTNGKFMIFELYFNLTMNGVLQNMTATRRIHNDPCPSSGIVLFA